MLVETDLKLEGSSICLMPLEMKHNEPLFEALKSSDVWKYTWRKVEFLEDINEIIADALTNKKNGTLIPFIIKEKETGKVIGSTRIGDIDIKNRNVEIGWTWISPEFWRTKVNTECKFLLLSIVLKC
jgi:RimJ/RimL family protein N-acetyltransferase